MRLEYKDRQKTHYVSVQSFQFEIRLERRTMEVVRLEALLVPFFYYTRDA